MTTPRMDEIVELVRDGKRYREKRGKWERFWQTLTVRILIQPIIGFSLMMFVGVVHHEWWPAVPTIGYWWAVLLSALIPGIFHRIEDGDKWKQ